TTHKIPLIIGTNDREAALFTKFGDDGMPLTVDKLKQMFGNTQPELYQQVIDGYARFPKKDVLVDLVGDAMFWKPSMDCAAGQSQIAPTYTYRYDFSTRALDMLGLGATHSTELIPVF